VEKILFEGTKKKERKKERVNCWTLLRKSHRVAAD
jgi:hypothetical protein